MVTARNTRSLTRFEQIVTQLLVSESITIIPCLEGLGRRDPFQLPASRIVANHRYALFRFIMLAAALPSRRCGPMCWPRAGLARASSGVTQRRPDPSGAAGGCPAGWRGGRGRGATARLSRLR